MTWEQYRIWAAFSLTESWKVRDPAVQHMTKAMWACYHMWSDIPRARHP